MLKVQSSTDHKSQIRSSRLNRLTDVRMVQFLILSACSPSFATRSSRSELPVAPGLVFFVHFIESFFHLDVMTSPDDESPGAVQVDVSSYVSFYV